MPTKTRIEYFDNDSFFGFVLKWIQTGRGFGEYVFSIDKKTGVFSIDNEDDPPEALKKVVNNLKIESVREMLYKMIDDKYKA